MKPFLFIILLSLVLTNKMAAQEHFRFKFKLDKILGPNISLLRKNPGTGNTYSNITSRRQSLFGMIKKTSDITGDVSDPDTLFTRLWPIKDNLDSGSLTFLNKNDNYKDFLLVIDRWPTHGKYRSIDIPFSSRQLFALNIPLRVNLKDGTIGSDFINANISLNRIWGKTRIYKTEFVKPRHRYWGVGLHFGLGTTKNQEEKEEIGLFYGGNILGSLFGINIIGTIGFESSISKDGRTSPYAGFGFGFDLFSITGLKEDD